MGRSDQIWAWGRGNRPSLLLCKPFRMKKFTGRLINAFVGMCAEVIALGLEQIGGEAFRAAAVIVAERGAEGWRGHAVFDRGLHAVAPVGLGFADNIAEVGIEDQVL